MNFDIFVQLQGFFSNQIIIFGIKVHWVTKDIAFSPGESSMTTRMGKKGHRHINLSKSRIFKLELAAHCYILSQYC